MRTNRSEHGGVRRVRKYRVRRCPNWLYRWVARRGAIPWIVRKLWPTAHWCTEMDALLVIDNVNDCFCGRCDNEQREYRREFFAAVRRKQAAFAVRKDKSLPF